MNKASLGLLGVIALANPAAAQSRADSIEYVRQTAAVIGYTARLLRGDGDTTVLKIFGGENKQAGIAVHVEVQENLTILSCERFPPAEPLAGAYVFNGNNDLLRIIRAENQIGNWWDAYITAARVGSQPVYTWARTHSYSVGSVTLTEVLPHTTSTLTLGPRTPANMQGKLDVTEFTLETDRAGSCLDLAYQTGSGLKKSTLGE